MFSDPQGPVEAFEWGRFQINGTVHSAEGEGVGKDICLVQDEVLPWEERKGHRLKAKMVNCAIKPEINTLVIGTGARGAIRVGRKTREKIKAIGITTLIIEKTPKACQIYNQLIREGKNVALLAHGTC